jgi:glycoside/pentoside/hexuronide:cation symporter, GPH family
MTIMPQELKIQRLSLIQYALLALPLGFSGFPLYILAPDFYVIHYGMTLSSLGFCILFIRIFDAFQDPLIGIISDRYRGQTLFIMGVSACILVLSIYGLFNVSLFSALTRFFIFMTLSVTAYSVLTINLNSVGGLWFDQEKAQVQVSSVREIFSIIGLLIAVSMPNFLAKITDQDQIYKWFVFILLSFLIIGFNQFYYWYRRYSKKVDNNIELLSLNFFDFSSHVKKFFAIYFLSMFASSIPAVLVIFFVRDLLGATSYTGLFLLIYFTSAAVFMSFWTYVSNKTGKYQAWFFSMLMASLSFIWAFFLTKDDLWQYGLVCFMSGIALGGDLVFPPAIVSDHIHQSKSQKSASAYYSILNLLAKSSLAFASALSFFILDHVEFKAGGENFAISLTGLSIAYALIPCIIKTIAAFFVWKILIKSNPVRNNENI